MSVLFLKTTSALALWPVRSTLRICHIMDSLPAFVTASNCLVQLPFKMLRDFQLKASELLHMHLRSTFATWEGNIYLQRQGVCIGSCVAPVLSDLFLASLDRTIFER
ncbi:unnamed protein product, partial [Ixodes pacificus]